MQHCQIWNSFIITSHLSCFLQGMRRMPVDNYSVFYVVQEDKVIVTNVLYSASDIEKKLQAKLSQCQKNRDGIPST